MPADAKKKSQGARTQTFRVQLLADWTSGHNLTLLQKNGAKKLNSITVKFELILIMLLQGRINWTRYFPINRQTVFGRNTAEETL